MEGFKILRNVPVQEAKHMRARCSKSKGEYLIRLEHDQTGWYMVYAIKSEGLPVAAETAAETEEMQLKNGLSVGAEYACPYCGNRDIVRCGLCGRITCSDGGSSFTCANCGCSGSIKGIIQSVQTEDSGFSHKK